MKLALLYPVKPHVVNRAWGYYSPGEYERFGFARHNGVDLALVHGQPIFSPLEAEVVRIGDEPQGGGIFVSILSSHAYEFDDGIEARVLLDFMHCQEVMVREGEHVVPGAMLALGDSTGVTTGSHTHMQSRREAVIPPPLGATRVFDFQGERVCLQDIDTNDANNSFDPTPYFTGAYAVDDRMRYR